MAAGILFSVVSAINTAGMFLLMS
ncbi:hypothetical protein CCACVL1_02989, partial [Corchorus capsularis]